MKFRTSLPQRTYPFQLNYDSRIMSLGSCFAEHMGRRLSSHLFNIISNSFGIVYHPLALANSLKRLISAKAYVVDELLLHNALYHSLDHHGEFSKPNVDVALENINQQLEKGAKQLEQADVLYITFGTSWGYFHLEKNTWAANCHKIPQQAFRKQLTSSEEMVSAWQELIKELLKKNAALQLVLTVSPVRHIKDGLENNQVSKANLRLLCAGLEESFAQVHYFPAYEIMQDDLRDYRFYEADLIHPNQMAQDYIWNYFQQAFFDKNTLAQYSTIANLVQAAAHRPFHPASEAHQNFIVNQIEKLEALATNHPMINFGDLRNAFTSQQITVVD